MSKITSLTPEEIHELEMRPSDVLREKLAATASEETLAAYDAIVANFMGIHDGYLLQAHTAESALYKEVGPDKYKDYMYDYFVGGNKPMLDGYWEMPWHDRLLTSLNAPRMFHNCKLKILGEDDKKVWFVMDPCGAGQKLYDMGCFEGGCNCASAHPVTANNDNFPVYCIHAPLMELIANDMGTAPYYQQDYPENCGHCSCVFNIYKNIEDIPDSYFERIGRKRP